MPSSPAPTRTCSAAPAHLVYEAAPVPPAQQPPNKLLSLKGLELMHVLARADEGYGAARGWGGVGWGAPGSRWDRRAWAGA